ncbi:MAG: TorF family putative porin [Stagnimonas sp.]|nr:TorF family putative porin [Stagnimonas sp.]
MKMKQIVACAAVLAASSVAAPAFAGATGNVGAYSEYMFRGVEQSGGAAVQGGLDYAHDSGVYVGTWLSNTSFLGTNGAVVSYETDVYAGYATKIGDLGLDVGALYYYYTDDSKLNTIEGYLGGSYGPISVKGFYTTDYFGTDEDGIYVVGTGTFPLSSSVNLVASVGSSSGDGVKALFGESYIDYGVGLTKSIDGGFTFSLSALGTDIDGDKTKAVLGLKKVFDL